MCKREQSREEFKIARQRNVQNNLQKDLENSAIQESPRTFKII